MTLTTPTKDTMDNITLDIMYFFFYQANALVNSLIGESRISTLGLLVVDEVINKASI